MVEQKHDTATQEKAPEKYKILDGFIKSNLLFKAVWILAFPIAPIIIEGLEYRNAQNRIEQHEDKHLQAIGNRIGTKMTSSEFEQKANSTYSELGTKFQDMVTRSKSPAVGQGQTR